MSLGPLLLRYEAATGRLKRTGSASQKLSKIPGYHDFNT
jgi:hypothetical protein